MARSGWVNKKCIKTEGDSARWGPKWTWGEGNIGDEIIIGRYDAGTRNKEESMVVDFAKRIDLAFVKTYFKKMNTGRRIKVAEKISK